MSLLLNNLRIVGSLLAVLGLSHAIFPKHFGWWEECQAISPLTRQVHYVHNGFIGLVVFLNGVLCLLYANDLVASSRLAMALLVGMALFWLVRLGVQLFFYSPALWRGKRFETRVHVCFVLLWSYISAVFLFGIWHQLG